MLIQHHSACTANHKSRFKSKNERTLFGLNFIIPLVLDLMPRI